MAYYMDADWYRKNEGSPSMVDALKEAEEEIIRNIDKMGVKYVMSLDGKKTDKISFKFPVKGFRYYHCNLTGCDRLEILVEEPRNFPTSTETHKLVGYLYVPEFWKFE